MPYPKTTILSVAKVKGSITYRALQARFAEATALLNAVVDHRADDCGTCTVCDAKKWLKRHKLRARK